MSIDKDLTTIKRFYGEHVYLEHYSDGFLIKTENPNYISNYVYENERIICVEHSYKDGTINHDYFEYDSLGRKIKEIYSDGIIREYEYKEFMNRQMNVRMCFTKVIIHHTPNDSWEIIIEEGFDDRGRLLYYISEDRDEIYEYNE